MKNHIAEDLPARKFAPAAAGAPPVDKRNKKDKSTMTSKERVSQAASDIRYKANLKGIPYLQEYEEYMKKSELSNQEKNMVKAKLLGKGGGGIRAEDFNPIFKNAASDNVAKALFKVFVEKKEINIEDLKEFYTRRNSRGEVVFHVRITDKKTKNSYTRDVTREKLNKLRANPNIDIEMSEYRKDYEIERTKGALTARVAAGKGLDPVGQEDGDVDNDGDKDKSDKYLMKRRGAIGNAIATRKEEFIHEAGGKKKSKKKNSDKLDVMPPGKSNRVTIAPTQDKTNALMNHQELEGELIAENGYSKFLKKVKEEMEGDSDENKKKGKESGCEDDSRAKYAEKEVIKNKLRAALGIKNPIVMTAGYNPEGNTISERENDEPGERDDRPDVKAHNRAIGYKPKARRPDISKDPRFGSVSGDDENYRSTRRRYNR